MSELRQFIKRQCVYSKLAEKPVVGQHGATRLVFAHGYPMTLRGFYTLGLRAVFGNTVLIKPDTWKLLNAETKILSEGLNLKLEEGREALSVVEGIRASMNWNKQTAETRNATNPWQYDRSFLFKWVESVEEQIAALDGLTLPGPQLQ